MPISNEISVSREYRNNSIPIYKVYDMQQLVFYPSLLILSGIMIYYLRPDSSISFFVYIFSITTEHINKDTAINIFISTKAS